MLWQINGLSPWNPWACMKTQQSPEISCNKTCMPLSGSQIDAAVLLIPYLQVVLTMSKYVHKYDSKMTREWMAVSEWNSTAVSWAFNRVAWWILMNDKLAICGPIALKCALIWIKWSTWKCTGLPIWSDEKASCLQVAWLTLWLDHKESQPGVNTIPTVGSY